MTVPVTPLSLSNVSPQLIAQAATPPELKTLDLGSIYTTAENIKASQAKREMAEQEMAMKKDEMARQAQLRTAIGSGDMESAKKIDPMAAAKYEEAVSKLSKTQAELAAMQTEQLASQAAFALKNPDTWAGIYAQLPKHLQERVEPTMTPGNKAKLKAIVEGSKDQVDILYKRAGIDTARTSAQASAQNASTASARERRETEAAKVDPKYNMTYVDPETKKEYTFNALADPEAKQQYEDQGFIPKPSAGKVRGSVKVSTPQGPRIGFYDENGNITITDVEPDKEKPMTEAEKAYADRLKERTEKNKKPEEKKTGTIEYVLPKSVGGLQAGKSISFPNQEALDKFKKDYGL